MSCEELTSFSAEQISSLTGEFLKLFSSKQLRCLVDGKSVSFSLLQLQGLDASQLKAIGLKNVLDSQGQQAALAEYGTLRTEIEGFLKHIGLTEQAVLVGIAGVWAWLAINATSLDSEHFHLAWAIPFFLVCFGAARSSALYTHVTIVGKYIKENIEPKLGMGWEQFPERKKGFVVWFTTGYWVILGIVTLSVWLWHGNFNTPKPLSDNADAAVNKASQSPSVGVHAPNAG